MGIRVLDGEDPAAYNCTYAQHNKNNSTLTCHCMCSRINSRDCNSSSGRSESSPMSDCSSNNTNSNINTTNVTCTCNTNTTNCCNCCCHKPTPPTLTLIFANNNSSSSTEANKYHYCKTEMLQTPHSDAAAQILTHSTKDLVGNSKEYRIENNKFDLRIIGNSNRIRIGCNQGNLQIIGNCTRLKITNNTGKIRYTGNEGRICLGSDSIQQAVDYIGNNGKLKVVKAAELLNEKYKNHKQKIPKEESVATTTHTSTMSANGAEQKYATSAKITTNGISTTIHTEQSAFSSTYSTPKKLKVKSASFAGVYCAKWQQFNELFKRHDWRDFGSGASMPNLKNNDEYDLKCGFGFGEKSEQNTKHGNGNKKSNKFCRTDNSINIANTYGNICIKNAVNVSI
ncbi:putative uncharacterized protein DDB_G0282133 [Eurosta solidaginis]|uniref:putative uncharacterized protein DDB_G0282133 n=1 Tax=Eurosta solidaginis TaxID=178769 RepID=UPI003530BD37